MKNVQPSLLLLAAVGAALLPHLYAQPAWLAIVLFFLLLLRGVMRYRQVQSVPRWLATVLAVTLAMAVFQAHQSLIGREGGIALLACLIIAKLFESRDLRDQTVLVMLGYFSTVAFFLHAQSPVMALMALASCLLLTSANLQRVQPQSRSSHPIRQAGGLLLQALPLALLLFLLFPRLPSPLWQMPSSNVARSGLSGDMLEPGQVSKLALDDSVAFRVEFAGSPPPPSFLYWRGPVFENFDGSRWLPASRTRQAAPSITAHGKVVDYTLTLEPHQQRWLLALDMPTRWPSGSVFGSRLELLSLQPVHQPRRYSLQSALAWKIENDPLVRTSSQLPPSGNPRTHVLADDWKSLPPTQRISAALSWLRSNDFVYTLEPPLLTSSDPIDEFLFTSRQGFCEHFASSFAYLMRAAGVPARIVTGYQGGSWNKAGNYLIVRQADAHAWVEVWLDGQGWQRIDPTAAVAPQRISQGLSASVPQGDTLPLMLRSESSWLKTLRLNADVLVNGWNHWVIGYNRQRQLDLLGMLGIGELGSGRYVVWLLGSFLLVSGLLVTWIMRPQRKLQEDQARRLYQAYCRKLARCRISVLPQEGPSDFARRAAMARPDLAQDIQSITTCYLAVRYGEKQEMMHVLQRLVRQFSP